MCIYKRFPFMHTASDSFLFSHINFILFYLVCVCVRYVLCEKVPCTPYLPAAMQLVSISIHFPLMEYEESKKICGKCKRMRNVNCKGGRM